MAAPAQSEGSITIVALVGSLRKASINRQLAVLAADNAPAGVRVQVVDTLDTLPFYSEDTDPATDPEAAPIEAVTRVREVVGAADAVLLVTPEYNGTIPAVLKNAIDWLSRPYGAGAVYGKPVGVIGAALGRFGGTWSRADARKSVGIAGGQVVEDVEVGVQGSPIGADGVVDQAVVDQVVTAVQILRDEARSAAAVAS